MRSEAVFSSQTTKSFRPMRSSRIMIVCSSPPRSSERTCIKDGRAFDAAMSARNVIPKFPSQAKPLQASSMCKRNPSNSTEPFQIIQYISAQDTSPHPSPREHKYAETLNPPNPRVEQPEAVRGAVPLTGRPPRARCTSGRGRTTPAAQGSRRSRRASPPRRRRPSPLRGGSRCGSGGITGPGCPSGSGS